MRAILTLRVFVGCTQATEGLILHNTKFGIKNSLELINKDMQDARYARYARSKICIYLITQYSII